MVTEANIQQFSQQCKGIFEQLGRDMIGQKDVIEGTVIAMIAGGNVLLEGVPGVGKTRLVRSLGRVFALPFSRIQFTPDLMPADVTGTNIIVKDEEGNSKFSFQPGPIFSNIILADEINRATPKTQSALLEAMQEHTVTVMGVSRSLAEPFFVLATQNPIEQDGTYPLPEAQMDRFMFKLLVPNPGLDELMDIVNMTQKTMAEVAEAACSGEELLEMRRTANQIPVAEEVMRYAMTLTSATHPDSECATEASKKYVRLGASPRAGQALISAAKVKALIAGRYNVSYADINDLAYPVLRHRIKLNFEAVAERISPDEIITMIINEVGKRSKIVVTRASAKPQAAPETEAEDDEDVAPAEKQEELAEGTPSKQKGKNGLFKMMKRMNSNMIGIVTGSDFRNGSLPNAYLGRGEKSDKKTKLLIYGEKVEDFVFGKEDVASCTVLQQEANFKMGSNQQKMGPKYEIKFKNGKTAIVCVPANAAYLVEQIVF